MTGKAFLLFLLAVAYSVDASKWVLLPGGDGKAYLVDLDQRVEPIEVEESDVTFLLYTTSTRVSPETMIIGDTSTLGSFSASRPTRLGIHGWMSNEGHLEDVRNGWLDSGDYNVIMVDWSGPAGNLIYSSSKQTVVEVGEFVAQFIDYLVAQGASAADMEIAGHSLGAHVAGVAGNRAAATLGRITALDPAAPLFGDDDVADRVDSSDASFVQVIHTSVLGWVDPLGHADFFPNGGIIQAGCNILVAATCSHSRSHQLYGESATTTVGFWSTQCDSYDNFKDGACSSNSQVLMGATTPDGTSGTYYLDTADSSPYALG